MLLCGSLIYMLFRREIIFVEYFIPPSFIDSIYVDELNSDSFIGYFAIYNLPDALWYGALLIFQSTFHTMSNLSKIIMIISILLPFVWEFMQLFEIAPGTFDLLDILAYFITLIIFLISFKSKCLSINTY